METGRGRSLATARCVATILYVVPLVVFPFVGRMVRPEVSIRADVLRMLGLALVVIGVVDYGISLFLERKMLPPAGSGPGSPARALAAAALVASFGASLAVYGLVITLLGAPIWGAALYVMCAAHGFHLMVRWPRYARAAEGMPYE